MTIYNIIIILLIIGSICESSKIWGVTEPPVQDTKSKDLYFKLLCILLFIVSASRHESIGIDMARYVPRFHIIASTPFSELHNLPDNWKFEYGFIVYCKIISLIFGDNIFPFIAISSALISIGIYKFIDKYSKLKNVSLLIYVCYGYWGNSFNTVRQYIAISLLLWALTKFEDKKYVSCMLITIFAISIHSTAIVFIPVVLLIKYPYKRNALFIFIIIGIIINLIPNTIINILLSYSSYEGYIGRAGSGGTTIIVLLFLLIAAYVLKDKIKKDDTKIDLWLWMLSIGICTAFLALQLGLFERIMRYYLVALLIIGSDILVAFRNKKWYIILSIGMVGAFSLYFYFILMVNNGSGGIIPYRSMDFGSF